MHCSWIVWLDFFVELIGLNRSTDFSSLKSANNLQHSPYCTQVLQWASFGYEPLNLENEESDNFDATDLRF